MSKVIRMETLKAFKALKQAQFTYPEIKLGELITEILATNKLDINKMVLIRDDAWPLLVNQYLKRKDKKLKKSNRDFNNE